MTNLGLAPGLPSATRSMMAVISACTTGSTSWSWYGPSLSSGTATPSNRTVTPWSVVLTAALPVTLSSGLASPRAWVTSWAASAGASAASRRTWTSKSAGAATRLSLSQAAGTRQPNELVGRGAIEARAARPYPERQTPFRGASMTERAPIYTAEAHVTGGRTEGHGRTSDGALEVDLRVPGGSHGGTNPEQLFAVGYASCFESALGAVARRRRQEAGDVAIDSKVMLVPTEDRAFKLAVELAVTLPSVEDADEAVELVRAAHQVCPYSNATRGNIDVALTANDRSIEEASEPATS